MRFYDIGVNAGANNGFLIFIIAPILLVALYTVATACTLIAHYFKKSQHIAMVIGIFLVIFLGLSAFFFHVQSKKDYPTEQPQDMALFLKYYLFESRDE